MGICYLEIYNYPRFEINSHQVSARHRNEQNHINHCWEIFSQKRLNDFIIINSQKKKEGDFIIYHKNKFHTWTLRLDLFVTYKKLWYPDLRWRRRKGTDIRRKSETKKYDIAVKSSD